MKTLAAILVSGVFVFFLYLVWEERSTIEQANRVSALLSNIAEDRNESIKSNMTRYRRFVKSCLPFFYEREELLHRVKEGEKLLIFLDSALASLKTLESLEHDRGQADHAYENYKALVHRHSDVIGKEESFLFNEYPGLDQGLLPEEIHAEGRSAVKISVVVLEESLLSAVERRLEETVGEIAPGDCP